MLLVETGFSEPFESNHIENYYFPVVFHVSYAEYSIKLLFSYWFPRHKLEILHQFNEGNAQSLILFIER